MITNVGYTSITGLTTVTTSTAHNLSVGNEIVLSRWEFAFTCDYAPGVGVQSAIYTNTTGIMTVEQHLLLMVYQQLVRVVMFYLTGLGFTCALDNGGALHYYPRANSVTNPHGGDPIYCGTPVIGVASATQFTINAGISTVPTFYVTGGSAQPVLIAPRANNNSASGQDVGFDGSTVLRVLDATTFEVNTGISTRPHNYARVW